MRNDWFDRSAAERRLGMHRAALAAWTVVVLLFAIVFSVSGTRPDQTGSDRAIATLVTHSVQMDNDSCHCDDFDHLSTAPAPALC
jgi:hypothetical protein